MFQEGVVPEGVERRHYELGEEAYDFDVLVVDSPDKWPEAHEFKTTYDMPSVGGIERMSVKVQGLSVHDWEKVEETKQLPTPPSMEDKNELEKKALTNVYNAEVDKVTMHKQVEFFQIATEMTIPGNTPDEKLEFLAARDKAEVEALFTYVLNVASAMAPGRQVEIYDAIAGHKSNRIKSPMKDFSDWKVAAETKAYYRINRKFETHITEFPLKGISQARRTEIEAQCVAPIAPMVMGINPATGRRDARYLEPNVNDAQYQKALKASTQLRQVLLLDACLTFPVPGLSYAEKWDWISKRLIGDYVGITRFIDKELLSHRSRFDFFIDG